MKSFDFFVRMFAILQRFSKRCGFCFEHSLVCNGEKMTSSDNYIVQNLVVIAVVKFVYHLKAYTFLFLLTKFDVNIFKTYKVIENLVKRENVSKKVGVTKFDVNIFKTYRVIENLVKTLKGQQKVGANIPLSLYVKFEQILITIDKVMANLLVVLAVIKFVYHLKANTFLFLLTKFDGNIFKTYKVIENLVKRENVSKKVGGKQTTTTTTVKTNVATAAAATTFKKGDELLNLLVEDDF
ncbi:hypothetical protein FF38_11975 [Lucilia cuprina]|uniref:Uncharacterized protein n=1 Tax=Lucilia cuprina TaxID=7375 RepID=A0A0L0CGG5_LUCCU|nr:hypothetical protein FF38_11975 [Lucilia cuprina]